jgi:hypothetical protein
LRLDRSREDKNSTPIPTLNSNSLALPPPFDGQPVRNAFSEWFSHLARHGKQPIDRELMMLKALGFFRTPDELIRSINYAIANQYITLKNYAAETGGGQDTADAPGAVARALDSLDAEMRAEEAKRGR